MKRPLQILAALALSAAALAAHAQAVKILIPSNPGGGWDQTGRTIGKVMADNKLVSSVQYDNKGGAGGAIGLAQFVNSSKGDPNALMIGGQAMVAAVELNKSAVKVQQATPLARLVGEYSVIVVPATSPFKTMADVVKAFKADPGKVSWGAGSAGSTEHLLIGLIAKAVGVDPGKINYIAFKGGGEAVPAIIGGHVAVGASGLGEFAEHIKTGKMRALAVSSPAAMEGIPSLKEQGINVELANWRGVFAAPGITKAQRDELIAAVEKATKSKEWQESLKKNDWEGYWLPGDAYGAYIESENKRLGDILAQLSLGKK